MLVAVTGVNGFLGSHTAKALKRAGHDVRGLSRASELNRAHVGQAVDEWIAGDFGDPQSLAILTSGAAAVIHIAIDWAALNQGLVPNLEVNLLGSLQLVEAARRSKVEQILFVSTLDVYHEILTDRPLDETHPAWPNGIYGAMKAAIEVHLKTYHHTDGLNVSAWRPATMYGVNPKLERSHWYELVTRVKDGQRISTDQINNVVHVEDVANALTLALGDRSVSGEFYNLVDVDIASRHVAEIAKELSRSAATIDNRPISGPRRRFETRKALAFFNRHGNGTALRRGIDGVREYIGALLTRITEVKKSGTRQELRP